MPRVALQRDEFDRDKVRVYTFFGTNGGASRLEKWILSATIHVEDVSDIFGSNVSDELEDAAGVDVEVRAVVTE